MHKGNKGKEKPPGRPILIGINSLFSHLGEYLDTYLATKGQAFVKESQDIISLLQEQEVDDSTVLVTTDMESLYANIRQKDDMNATEWALHRYSDMKQEQIRFTLDGLDMSNNYFWHQVGLFIKLKV